MADAEQNARARGEIFALAAMAEEVIVADYLTGIARDGSPQAENKRLRDGIRMALEHLDKNMPRTAAWILHETLHSED